MIPSKTRSGPIITQAMKHKNSAKVEENKKLRQRQNAAADVTPTEQLLRASELISSSKTKTLRNKEDRDTELLQDASLFSPTATQKRVLSQERTPQGNQKNTSMSMSDEKRNSKGVKNQCLESGQMSTDTDENSNSVLQSPTGRFLLKQLFSTLSPKMTEIKPDFDRRVSRYGRHQKQKENVDYVPVELMRFVGYSPVKNKPKSHTTDSYSGHPESSPPNPPLIEEMSGDHSSSIVHAMISTPTLEHEEGALDSSPIVLSVIKNEPEEVLEMDKINIISMEESFESNKIIDNSPTNDQRILAQSFVEPTQSSDSDSAKGSSIDQDSGYLAGNIYWGAQSIRGIHWPCMVRNDPESGQITRKKGSKVMEVHVSFFGDRGRRGWIKETYMVPFKGVQNYRTRIEKMEFGKYVKRALKRDMPKMWLQACELAEEYSAISIEQRLPRFDASVKMELARMKLERYSKTRGIYDKTARSESAEVTVKRERSSSPESPEYEALPTVSTNRQPNAKKMKTSKTHSPTTNVDSNIDRFLHSLHHEDQINDLGDNLLEAAPNEVVQNDASKGPNRPEYDDILNFIRHYLYDGNTSNDIEEKLQYHVQQICSLKKTSHRGTERTVERQRMQALRKTFEKLGVQLPADLGNRTTAPVKSVQIKKEVKSLEENFILNLDRNFLIKGLPKGFLCYICNRPNDVTKCIKCLRHMHLVCLTDDPLHLTNLQTEMEEKRLHCPDCAKNVNSDSPSWQKCFICNDENEETKGESKYRCVGKVCSREYHLSCLSLFPQYRTVSLTTIICPYHACHTCVSPNPKGKADLMKVSLARCIKCPTAYHPSGQCIPAGSEMLTSIQLVCPKHSLDQTTLNVNWCFICCKGGNLICCESCPVACHQECLPFTPPDGKYFCEECESGRMPLYNEIVIAKMASFRWWPALTLPPSEVPENVLQLRQKPSDICVKFFQSHNMAWMNRRRMYLYVGEDSENLGKDRPGSLNEHYRSAMMEASKIFKALQANKIASLSHSAKKPKAVPMYTKIKLNRYIPPLKQPHASNHMRDTDEDYVCRCQPTDDDPCGPSSACINRAILMECSSKTCPAMERCSNQRFAKRIYPALEVRYFMEKGFGLVALEDLQNGQFVIEYVGEVINSEEFDKRIKMMETQKEENYYFFTVEPDMTIDAGPKGNVARFINHSCEPNCETQKWTIGETRVIGLFAIKDIKAGEELTFNYNLESLGNSKRICLCKSTKCSGFIGEKFKPTKKEPVNDQSGRVVKNKTKKMQNRKTNKKVTKPVSATKLRKNALDDEVEFIPGSEPVVVNLDDPKFL